MIRLPLHYSGCYICDALFDDNKRELCDAISPVIRVPREAYKLAGRRPDVVVALLKEDETLRHKIKPIVFSNNLQVLLSQAVVSKEIETAILRRIFSRREYSQFAFLRDIELARKDIKRIICENGNYCDLRRGNLRVLSTVNSDV